MLKWAIEQFGPKVAFWLADRNQMIINGYQKNMLWFYKFCFCMQILRMNFYEPLWFLVLWNSGLKLKMAIARSHANVPVYLVNKRLLFLDSVLCKLFLKPIVNSMSVVIDRDLFKGVWVPEMLLNFENCLAYTVFTNGGHAGKNWCLVMKARRWRVNKNCKWRLSVNLQSV